MCWDPAGSIRLLSLFYRRLFRGGSAQLINVRPPSTLPPQFNTLCAFLLLLRLGYIFHAGKLLNIQSTELAEKTHFARCRPIPLGSPAVAICTSIPEPDPPSYRHCSVKCPQTCSFFRESTAACSSINTTVCPRDGTTATGAYPSQCDEPAAPAHQNRAWCQWSIRISSHE